MKILIACDQGNNRSVTIAGLIKYWGHDVLTCGTATNSPETVSMLAEWADRIITTEAGQFNSFPQWFEAKHQLWDLGPDTYPRPYNPDLLKKAKAVIDQHKAEYKP